MSMLCAPLLALLLYRVAFPLWQNWAGSSVCAVWNREETALCSHRVLMVRCLSNPKTASEALKYELRIFRIRFPSLTDCNKKSTGYVNCIARNNHIKRWVGRISKIACDTYFNGAKQKFFRKLISVATVQLVCLFVHRNTQSSKVSVFSNKSLQ